jgi:hypothetical protein
VAVGWGRGTSEVLEPLPDLLEAHTCEPVHGTEGLAADVGDDPHAGLVAGPDRQAAIAESGREGLPVVGGLPGLTDLDPDVGQALALPLGALVLVGTERRFGPGGNVVADCSDGVRDVQAAFLLQGPEDTAGVPAKRRLVAPGDFEDTSELLVPGPVPRARQDPAGDRVPLWHADVPVPLVADPARPALHVLDDDRPPGVELELAGQGPDGRLGVGSAALLAWREHPVSEAELATSPLGVLERVQDVLAAAE